MDVDIELTFYQKVGVAMVGCLVLLLLIGVGFSLVPHMYVEDSTSPLSIVANHQSGVVIPSDTSPTQNGALIETGFERDVSVVYAIGNQRYSTAYSVTYDATQQRSLIEPHVLGAGTYVSEYAVYGENATQRYRLYSQHDSTRDPVAGAFSGQACSRKNESQYVDSMTSPDSTLPTDRELSIVAYSDSERTAIPHVRPVAYENGLLTYEPVTGLYRTDGRGDSQLLVRVTDSSGQLVMNPQTGRVLDLDIQLTARVYRLQPVIPSPSKYSQYNFFVPTSDGMSVQLSYYVSESSYTGSLSEPVWVYTGRYCNP